MQRTKSRWAVLALTLVTTSGLPLTTSAHHSFAMFDQDRKVSLQGVVRKIEWANPHIYFLVEVTGAKGVTQLYTLEAGSVNKMVRKGWKPNTLEIGESISFSIHPFRNGEYGGMLESITKESGDVYPG